MAPAKVAEIKTNTNGLAVKKNYYLRRRTIMKKFVCTVCGYVHEGDTPPEECPLCGVGPEFFEEVEE